MVLCSWDLTLQGKLLESFIIKSVESIQGDIEAVAAKQAQDITKLFETISGSEAYKAEFDESEVKRKEAQDRLAFVQSKKKNTAAEKRQKREQKTEAEKHIKMQQELVRVEIILVRNESFTLSGIRADNMWFVW